jgi:N-acetylmuramoyl-L-alanine amidase
LDLITPTAVILHCSATPDYSADNELFDFFGADEINDWHKQRGFDKIGYHIVVRRSGAIEYGRALVPPKVEKGAHCKPTNSYSIGICYIGTKIPTTAQIKSLKKLYKVIFDRYNISINRWFAHRDFAKTECPGFEMSVIRDLISI